MLMPIQQALQQKAIRIDIGDRRECDEWKGIWKFGGKAYVLVANKGLQELWRSGSLKMKKK